MLCPKCQSSTKVINTAAKGREYAGSRARFHIIDSAGTQRRRACTNKQCGHRFDTIEIEIDSVATREEMVNARARQLIAVCDAINLTLGE